MMGFKMKQQLKQACDRLFDMDSQEGISKVMPLKLAVEQFVKPSMSLHFSFTHNRAHGAAYEIARQYWGSSPEFTLIATGVLEYGILMVYGGLVKKVVAAFYGDTYPTSGPNPILQRAFSKGEVELENWTNLTIPLRLMAAAYDLPFIATNSLCGSSMEMENKETYYTVRDPRRDNKETGVVLPLKPDLTILHGYCADPYGNTILLPPFGENLWGAYASKSGVLVTVEKIVSTSYIRKFSHLVKLPGHLVRSVSPVPFGAHPQGMSNQGIPEMNAYGEDHDFRLKFREASKDHRQFADWVKYWVLECKNQGDYLEKLGFERLMILKGKADNDSWVYDIQSKLQNICLKGDITTSELMIAVTAQIIQDKVVSKGYKNVLAGIGLSSLASSVAYYWLKRKEQKYIDLLAETGFYGYAPRPGDPFVFNFNNIPTNKMQSNFVDILNLFAGGNNNQCLGVLATGQVDKHGNINSTRLADGRYLVGSGGSNDITNGSEEVIIVLRQSKQRFVNKLPYVTSVGNRITTLISNLGIFEKCPGNDEFILTRCLPSETGSSLTQQIRNIEDNCGWKLKIASDVSQMAVPPQEAIQLIRLLDPEGSFSS